MSTLRATGAMRRVLTAWREASDPDLPLHPRPRQHVFRQGGHKGWAAYDQGVGGTDA